MTAPKSPAGADLAAAQPCSAAPRRRARSALTAGGKFTNIRGFPRPGRGLNSFGVNTLANIQSAKKRARQAVTRRAHNMSLRSRMRTAIKKVEAGINAGDRAAAEAGYKAAVPVIDTMVSKGIVHANKAARHKSRLNARIREMQA